MSEMKGKGMWKDCGAVNSTNSQKSKRIYISHHKSQLRDGMSGNDRISDQGYLKMERVKQNNPRDQASAKTPMHK